jgi:hypothetical protein
MNTSIQLLVHTIQPCTYILIADKPHKNNNMVNNHQLFNCQLIFVKFWID